MQRSESNRARQAGRVGVGLTGAAGGTLAVFLASLCAEDSNLRKVLIYLSPTISVVVTGVSSWARGEILRRLREREIQRTMKMAQSAIHEALENPETSADHKDQCRKDLEQVERLAINNQLSRLHELTGSTDLKVDGDRKDVRHHR